MTAIDRQAPFRHWTASQRGPHGQVAEWLKAADCKSARVSRTLVRIQPCPPPSNPRASAEIPRNRRKPSVLSSNPSPFVRRRSCATGDKGGGNVGGTYLTPTICNPKIWGKNRGT